MLAIGALIVAVWFYLSAEKKQKNPWIWVTTGVVIYYIAGTAWMYVILKPLRGLFLYPRNVNRSRNQGFGDRSWPIGRGIAPLEAPEKDRSLNSSRDPRHLLLRTNDLTGVRLRVLCLQTGPMHFKSPAVQSESSGPATTDECATVRVKVSSEVGVLAVRVGSPDWNVEQS